MVHTVRSIDSLLTSISNNEDQATPITPPIENEENIVNDEVKADINESQENNNKHDYDGYGKNNKEQNDDQVKNNNETYTDEYGNEVKKPKIYSEEEVNRMMRERFNRGAFKNMQQPQPQPQPQLQKQQPDFEYDPDSEETWQSQLQGFVKQTIFQMNDDIQNQQKQQNEQRIHAEFEDKFHQGMEKLPDFIDVINGKPINDNMVKAIRGLDNPAAFLYAAAKNSPKELERIHNIQDPFIQASEMGKLHERMSKRKASSNAPRPVSLDRSDVSDKKQQKVSIDYLIQQDAANRYKR